jgi:hypothetical protein
MSVSVASNPDIATQLASYHCGETCELLKEVIELDCTNKLIFQSRVSSSKAFE